MIGSMTRRSLLAAAFVAASLSAAAAGAPGGTRDEAVALAHKAAELYKEKGKESLAIINDRSGPFVDRDLYVAVVDANGVVLAHAATPKMVGKSLIDLKDADGKLFVQDLAGFVKANKSGWVNYRWLNPVSKDIEPKASYIETQGGLGFMVGTYGK